MTPAPAILTYRPRKATNAIVLHDSHTPPSVISGEDHLTIQGRIKGLLSVGYHFIIDRDGQVQECRPHATMGSHCPGRNHDTIGVCLMGGLSDAGDQEDNILAQQLVALRTLVMGIRGLYGGSVPILGHGEVQNPHDRACPCVDMKEIRAVCR